MEKRNWMKWGKIGALAISFVGVSAFADTAEEVEEKIEALLPKEGVSLQELQTITARRLEFRLEGRTLRAAGAIPERCAKDADMIVLPPEEGKHLVMIRMPKCEDSFRPVKGEKMVAASSVFPRRELADHDGKVFLRHLRAGDEDTEARNAVPELLRDARGAEMVIVSEATRAARARAERIDELAKRVDRLCRSGEFEGVGQEIEAARDLLGDVSALLDKKDDLEKKRLHANLEKAKNAAEAKKAFDSLVEAADRGGWDMEPIEAAYVKKRTAILRATVQDVKEGEGAVAAAEKALVEWKSELQGMNSDLYKANQRELAAGYYDLARAARDSSPARSAALLEKAKSMGPKSAHDRLDGEIAESYAEAFKECVKGKSPQKAAKCQKEFAKKSQTAADRVKDRLEKKAAKDEDAQEELQGFM
ncbi:MAG: hypothetical protein HUU37_06530, partial [Bdellovibrionales bacterium]|nr:hypothetical protein [Bdellovibrionales bacterium]